MRSITLCAIASLLAGCASVPAPATRSPQNPAHPAAPEGVTPPAAPLLRSEAEGAPVPPSEPTAPAPAMQKHEGHQAPAPSPSPGPSPPAVMYTCPMHPQVEAEKPGTCPICGMTLIKKDKPRPQGGASR